MTVVPDIQIAELVDGEWAAPSQRLGPMLENPNTGAPLTAQVATSDDRIERAVAAADRAHAEGDWASYDAAARADVLDAVAAELEPRAERIAELEALGTGVVRTLTGMLSVIVPGAFRMAAEQLRAGVLLDTSLPGPTGRPVEVHRRPLGPAVCLVPWNAPAPMAAHKVANALAAGCPVILKPSEWAPHGTTVMAQGIADALAAAGVPRALFQLVQGGAATGARLVGDPRVRAVSFTGGVTGGRAIAGACAHDLKPAQLELGGNNALVILDDAPAETAAQAVVDLMTALNGQWCRALGRLLLPAERADELLGATLDRLAKVRIGSSLDVESEMGPMVHSGHRAMLQSRVASYVEAGGTAHAVTPLPDLPGNFLAPTLVTGLRQEAAAEEVFGPVATVHAYDDVEHAVALANGTGYGLEAYVVGRDEERALAVARRVRAGGVKVNGTSPLSLHLLAPRPAWGLSGLGVEGTVETLQFFTGQQVVGVEGSLPGLA